MNFAGDLSMYWSSSRSYLRLHIRMWRLLRLVLNNMSHIHRVITEQYFDSRKLLDR
jgi:hypothetical protein